MNYYTFNILNTRITKQVMLVFTWLVLMLLLPMTELPIAAVEEMMMAVSISSE